MALTHATNGFAKTPLFVQVQDWVLSRIAAGELDGVFPSEIDLGHMAGVSSGTMRKALDALEARGLVDRIHGRGTFARKRIDVKTLPEPARDLIKALASYDRNTRDRIAKAIQDRLHELAKG